ncbi:MAG: HlyD family secretion protein [Lacisediminimonas sp.]|nr:HlyD family secretion protein [Lacisediminimonas sp.]
MSDAAEVGDDQGAKPAGGLQGLLRRRRLLFMISAPVSVLAVIAWFMLTAGRYEETDNAFVQAARVPISTSITGRIVDMRVRENEYVAAGQVLFVLDRANPEADLSQAQAALAAARTRVAALEATFGARVAAQRSAEDGLAFARKEQARARLLATEGIASRQDVEAADHAVDAAASSLAAARQGVAVALAELGGRVNAAIDDHPAVREAAARLERTRLALSYTLVIAPQTGVVTKVDQVQRGSFVNAGQTLFWLIAGDPWIEANFKEDQIESMRAGQSATVRFDAYPGKVFEARIASFSPGTGAVFSALPPQNATGNWVKVVQRIPVRLVLVNPPPGFLIGAGMSAKVRVDTRPKAATIKGKGLS